MKYNPKIVEAYYKECNLPTFEWEYRFCPDRKWRFDLAWPNFKVALEVEGAIWTGGRHTRGAGFSKDIEKYNYAARDGWLVLRTTPDRVCMRDTADMILETIQGTIWGQTRL